MLNSPPYLHELTNDWVPPLVRPFWVSRGGGHANFCHDKKNRQIGMAKIGKNWQKLAKIGKNWQIEKM